MNYMHNIQKYMSEPIDTFRIETTGWDNIGIIINEEWVFRFPRNERVRQRIGQDQKRLLHLREHVAIEIPDYKLLYDGRKRITGCYYQMIEGHFLTKTFLESLHEEEQMRVAQQLAAFMVALHRTELDLSYYREHDEDFWKQQWQEVKNYIFPLLTKQECDRVRSYFMCLFEFGKNNTCSMIHGDLSGSHLLYKEGLHGVIDFGDMCIGDPAYEFSRLYEAYGEDFTNNIISFYQQDTPFPEDETFWVRVEQYYKHHFLFSELLYAIQIDNKKSVKKYVEKIKSIFASK